VSMDVSSKLKVAASYSTLSSSHELEPSNDRMGIVVTPRKQPPTNQEAKTPTTATTSISTPITSVSFRGTNTSSSFYSSSPSIPLLDMARVQDWSSILHRVQKHPREARRRDADGLFPLHWACSGDPPSRVVKRLLQAFPDGAVEVDNEGSTALHFACHYGVRDIHVVQVLLQYNPHAASAQDVHGRTPLYHACAKGASLDVLKILVQYYPQAVTMARIRGHRTPLSMVWKNALSVGGAKDGDAWEKAMLLLYVAYTGVVPTYNIGSIGNYSLDMEGTDVIHSSRSNEHGIVTKKQMLHQNLDSSSPPFYMLHASIEVLVCPVSVFDEALRLLPEQVQQKDSSGNLPLAVVVAVKGRSSLQDVEGGQEFSDRLAYQIRTLLRAHPRAARIPNEAGRLPLFVALENGLLWDEGVSDILKNHMDALWVKDPRSRLYAFMLAAAKGVATKSKSNSRASRLFVPFCSLASGKRKIRKLDRPSGGTMDVVPRNVTTPYKAIAESRNDAMSASIERGLGEQGNKQLVSASSGSNCLMTSILAAKEGNVDSDRAYLSTVFELLIACPEAVNLK